MVYFLKTTDYIIITSLNFYLSIMENSKSSSSNGFLTGLGIAGGATVGVVIVILIIFCLCCSCIIVVAISAPSNRDTFRTNNNSSNSETQNDDAQETSDTESSGLEEGDVLEGAGRVEIEDEYRAQKKSSNLKANTYFDSLKGQNVVWVGTVTNVDNEFFGDGYQITMTMNGYTVDIRDPGKQYGDLNDGQLIKVSGSIDSLVDIGGITIYLDNATIEVVE